MVALLCFLLLPLVQGTMLAFSATSLSNAPPYELNSLDPLTGKFEHIAELGNDEPACGVLLYGDTVVYSLDRTGPEDHLNTVSLPSGQVVVGKSYPGFNFFNLGFDVATNRSFVYAYNSTQSQSYLFELLPNQTLRAMVPLMGTNSFEGTYSSSMHLFFAVTDRLQVVSTVHEKLLYSVPIALSEPCTLVYDDTAGVLYAWSYDNTRSAFLVSLDYTTGNIIGIVFESSTLSTGPAERVPTCINKGAIYTILLGPTSPVIHVLDLSTGNATQTPIDRYTMTLVC